MARIRSIFPGFFTDDDVVELTVEARLFLVGLWTECDDQGCFKWKPKGLKMKIFPADDINVEQILQSLVELNFVRKFEVQGEAFGAVKNFRKFQKPKKPNAIHPITAETRAYVGLPTSSSEPATPSKQKSSEPVRNQFPTSTEKSRLMEDGGWRMEDGSSSSREPVPSSEPPPNRPPPPPLLDRLAKILKLSHNTIFRRPKFAEFPGLYAEWVRQGCEPDRDIWPTIEKIAKRKTDISSPRFFETAVFEARDNRLAAEPSPAERWGKRVECFKKTGNWHHDWGPPPGSPGCTVPAECL